MNPPRFTRRDVAWGYLTQIVNLGGGLLLLPVLLLRLSSKEIGLWYVFQSIVALAQLAELALQPALARQVAYVYAGRQELLSEGLGYAQAAGGTMNLKLFARLFSASRLAYRLLSVAIALPLLVGGGVYVAHLAGRSPAALPYALPAWLAYGGGFLLASHFGYYNAFIMGRGDVAKNNQVVMFSKGVFVIVGAIAVLAGARLPGLGAASLLSAVASRLLAHRHFRRGEPASELNDTDAGAVRAMLAVLWPTAWRMWLVQFGSFLVTRSATLLASTFLSLEVVSRYALTVQILMTLSGVSSLFVTLQMPRMNAAQARHDRAELQGAFGLAVFAAWVVYVLGSFTLMAAGNRLLELLGSTQQLLDRNLLWTLVMIGFLEMNHSMAAMYLTTRNRVPFAPAALISGAAIVALGAMLCGLGGWGLWGLVLAQGIVQISYNNWKWPVEALRDLGIGPRLLIRAGYLEMRQLARGT